MPPRVSGTMSLRAGSLARGSLGNRHPLLWSRCPVCRRDALAACRRRETESRRLSVGYSVKRGFDARAARRSLATVTDGRPSVRSRPDASNAPGRRSSGHLGRGEHNKARVSAISDEQCPISSVTASGYVIITTTLKCSGAVGDARNMGPPENDAFLRVNLSNRALPVRSLKYWREYVDRRKPHHELPRTHNRDSAITTSVGPATHSAAADSRQPPRNSWLSGESA